MINSADFREFLYAIFLIGGFCVAAFFVQIDGKALETPVASIVMEAPHAVRIIANPVVHIAVPAHNVFAK